jgi:hypothetical protein
MRSRQLVDGFFPAANRIEVSGEDGACVANAIRIEQTLVVNRTQRAATKA